MNLLIFGIWLRFLIYKLLGLNAGDVLLYQKAAVFD